MGLHGLPPGFALNLDRGGDACVFGLEAVKKFLAETGCDYMLRAHQCVIYLFMSLQFGFVCFLHFLLHFSGFGSRRRTLTLCL